MLAIINLVKYYHSMVDLDTGERPRFSPREVLQLLREKPGNCLPLVSGSVEGSQSGEGSPVVARCTTVHIGELVTLGEQYGNHVSEIDTAPEATLKLAMQPKWRFGFDADVPWFRVSKRNSGELIMPDGERIPARLVCVTLDDERSGTDDYYWLTLD